MITDALLDLVGLILSGLSALLPNVEIPFWDDVMAFADNLNGWLFAFDSWFPLRDLAEAMRWMLAVWFPGWCAFHIFRYVWSHVPVLGGGK